MQAHSLANGAEGRSPTDRNAIDWHELNKTVSNQRQRILTGELLEPCAVRVARINRAFKATFQRVGLPKSTRFHDLRHTCATLLLEQGVHPTFVQDLLGHADISLTLNVYSHVLPDMGDATADAIEAALG